MMWPTDTEAKPWALQPLASVAVNMDQSCQQIPFGGGVVDIGGAEYRDLQIFAAALSSAWPVEDASSFMPLLGAIDDAAARAAAEAHRLPH